jgi:hypothetical protein
MQGLPEMLIVAQLVKKFYQVLWNPKFSCFQERISCQHPPHHHNLFLGSAQVFVRYTVYSWHGAPLWYNIKLFWSAVPSDHWYQYVSRNIRSNLYSRYGPIASNLNGITTSPNWHFCWISLSLYRCSSSKQTTIASFLILNLFTIHDNFHTTLWSLLQKQCLIKS